MFTGTKSCQLDATRHDQTQLETLHVHQHRREQAAIFRQRRSDLELRTVPVDCEGNGCLSVAYITMTNTLSNTSVLVPSATDPLPLRYFHDSEMIQVIVVSLVASLHHLGISNQQQLEETEMVFSGEHKKTLQ